MAEAFELSRITGQKKPPNEAQRLAATEANVYLYLLQNQSSLMDIRFEHMVQMYYVFPFELAFESSAECREVAFWLGRAQAERTPCARKMSRNIGSKGRQLRPQILGKLKAFCQTVPATIPLPSFSTKS
jgi:hypothetical protein